MKPFKGNIHWLLFGLSNMYNNAVELLVPEIITNAIEAGADKIIISFRKEDGNYFITFHNNGEKMSKSVFDKFNMFSESTKQYGQNLGFLGVGSKAILGRSESKQNEIYMTTGKLSSRIFYDSKNKEYQVDDQFIAKNADGKQVYVDGAEYTAKIEKSDYDEILQNGKQVIENFFNSALLAGIDIVFDGVNVNPWKPTIVKEIPKKIVVNDLEFPTTIQITKSDIPETFRNFQYIITHKVIITKRPFSIISNIKKDYQNKFYVMIDAKEIVGKIQSSKTSFKESTFKKIQEEIEKQVLKVLEKENMTIDMSDSQNFNRNWTRRLQEVLRKVCPELLLNSSLGIGNKGKEAGEGVRVKQENSKQDVESEEKEKEPPENQNRNGGFSVETVNWEHDSRMGWIATDDVVIVNLANPVSMEAEKSSIAKSFHFLRIVTAELFKRLSQSAEYTIPEAFEIIDQIHVEMTASGIKLQDLAKQRFEAQQIPRDDKTGRFLKK